MYHNMTKICTTEIITNMTSSVNTCFMEKQAVSSYISCIHACAIVSSMVESTHGETGTSADMLKSDKYRKP